MANGLSSAADIVNLALVRIGYPMRIGSLYDGSPAAKLALDVYVQTRDQMLRDGQWEFAERQVAGTLLKQAPAGGYGPWAPWTPAYPAIPWFFSYAYPDDCLKVRSVVAQPMFVPNFDPQYNVFSIENDSTYTPSKRVILCYVPDAVLIYAAQITDPTVMEASFIEAFSAELGRRLAPALVGMDAAKMEAQDAAMENQVAENNQG